MSKLTHKEHAARAMLMGLFYDWRDGTYCDGNYISGPTSEGMIDANTLEPIPDYEGSSRRGVTLSHCHEVNVKMDWKTPMFETEWARMDDDDP